MSCLGPLARPMLGAHLVFLSVACYLSTILIWWLRLLEDDDVFSPYTDFDFGWTYWVAVASRGVALLAFILTFAIQCYNRKGTTCA